MTNCISVTDRFIDQLYKMQNLNYSDSVIEQAKKCFLDYIGVTIAGAHMIRYKTDELINNFCTNNDSISLIGLDRKTGLLEAALINGINSHVAELDDGERFGMFHPGAPIFSALLPASQKFHIDSKDFYNGVIVGYESAIRLARALQPALKDKGFHGTGICGTIGAAIAVGVALNFNRKQLKDTLSAAATSASGLLKVLKGRSEMKPYNVGIAAQNGLNSALLVKAGFEGPEDVLDGEMGFLNAFTGKFDENQLKLEDNYSPAILGIYMKPYAACRHSHPAIDAAIILKNRYDLKTETIKAVNIRTYYWAVGGHEHTEIVGISSAKMSTPFSVAVALETGRAGINEFTTDWINNKNIKLLTQKINVCADDELTSLVPEKRGAIVQIHTNSNQCFEEGVFYPKGEPESALSFNDVKEKFMELCKFAGKDNTVYQGILNNVLSTETDLIKLIQLL
jgi:2-methylcitrate dehydratase PrpD